MKRATTHAIILYVFLLCCVVCRFTLANKALNKTNARNMCYVILLLTYTTVGCLNSKSEHNRPQETARLQGPATDELAPMFVVLILS